MIRRHAAATAIVLAAMGLVEANAAEIELVPGFAGTVSLAKQAGTVVVGNPLVADVMTVPNNPRAMLVTAKAVGLTNVIVIDGDGKEFLNLTVKVVSGPEMQGRITLSNQPKFGEETVYACGATSCIQVTAEAKVDRKVWPLADR